MDSPFTTSPNFGVEQTGGEGWVGTPPPPPAQEAEVVEEPVKLTEWQGLPVRADSDKVFLLKDGKKHWFTSAEAFSRLGFKFGDEVRIDAATLSVIPEGEPIR